LWIPRQLRPQILRLAATFPIVVLVGPRQVGKTSLLENAFGGIPVVPLDVAGNAELAETRPEEFLARFPPPVVLDEIQYAPKLFRYLKASVDQRRGENGLFILTGSQSYPLMEAVSESLAGRAAIVPFLGLSGEEWSAVDAVRADAGWFEFLWRGGYPALWARGQDSPSRDRWYQGYLATYLERDVRNLMNVGNLRDFERFLRACAARTAQTLNYADLGRDVGVSPNTIKQWLSVLQASGQVLLLEPYHRSLGKRLVKSPKLYFTETGLAAFLMGFASAEALRQNASASGALFENYVVGQWIRWRDWVEPGASLWWWSNGTHEVDLVIERNARLYGIEVKLAQNPDGKSARGLDALKVVYGELVERRFVACTTSVPFAIDPETLAQPGWTVWNLDVEPSGEPRATNNDRGSSD
jgi:predicted AAA+ superfamily ATPase